MVATRVARLDPYVDRDASIATAHRDLLATSAVASPDVMPALAIKDKPAKGKGNGKDRGDGHCVDKKIGKPVWIWGALRTSRLTCALATIAEHASTIMLDHAR